MPITFCRFFQKSYLCKICFIENIDVMSILKIYSCHHPILKKKTEPVTEINDEIKNLVGDMFETMKNADGAGLSANQVGVSKSVVVIDISYYEKRDYKPLVMINPKIVSTSEETTDFEEGCLSIPGVFETVKRPKEVEVEFYDLDMKLQRLKDDDLLARVIQHELDHLNAELFIEKISPLRRAMIKNKVKRIAKGDFEQRYDMVLK